MKKLAEVAKRCHIPIASGSLSSALKDPSLSESFTVLRDKKSRWTYLCEHWSRV